MTTATIETTKISHLTAKAILTKANLGLYFVGTKEYHGTGFRFCNNAFFFTSSYSSDRECDLTLRLISYLNKAGIAYEIAKLPNRWNQVQTCILLTNGGK